MNTLIYKQDSCAIIGVCIRVQKQTLNYLHVNFGEDRLNSKRTVL